MASAACADANGAASTEGVEVDLLDHQAWVETAAADDPEPSHRPDEVLCGIAGWYPEADLLEVDTRFCNYAALEQPLAEPLRAGDTLSLAFHHFDLTAPEPSEGHLMLFVGQEPLFEYRVPIPAPGDRREVALTVAEDAPAGTPLYLHLHNHGQNNWRVEWLRLLH